MVDQSLSSATSLIVKSNSLRATKSITGPSRREPSASTATLAPIMPIFSAGLAAFIASAHFTSEAKEGTEVCSTARSKSFTMASTSASVCLCGGASIRRLFSTRAAGWASHVGYQNDLISRRAW